MWGKGEVVGDEEVSKGKVEIGLWEGGKIDGWYEVGEEVRDEVIFEKLGGGGIVNVGERLG